MQFIMFTKHLQGYDVSQIIEALKSAGMDGADLCVRPGYPVHPGNVRSQLHKVAQQFADHGLSIPLVTTPGDFLDPNKKEAERVFEGCSKAGVKLIKLGYWHFAPGQDYWKLLRDCKRQVKGFARLGKKHGVKAVVHNHSGLSMGLNSSAAFRLVEDCDPKDIGIFSDTGHLSLVGEPLPMALSIVKRYVSCFAFKDLINWPKRGVVRVGHGLVDWDAAAKTIVDMKLTSRPISMHSEYAGESPETIVDLARIDLRFIKGKFARHGAKV